MVAIGRRHKSILVVVNFIVNNFLVKKTFIIYDRNSFIK